MSKEKEVQIIFDPNIYISSLISERLFNMTVILNDERFKVVLSEELLEEFVSVAKRDKFRKYFGLEKFQERFDLIKTNAKLIEVTSAVDICRDPKDNYLLSLAADSNADYLISGDKDLTELGEYGKTLIIKLRTFIDLFNLSD